jgi:alpha-1,2-mannosyltransferase
MSQVRGRPTSVTVGTRRLGAVMLATGVVAVVARGWLVLRHAGVGGLHDYDDGVYYAGSAALVAGRLPYRDFLFLHPPGILLALSPFSALAAVTSDPVGLGAARAAFWVLGGLNAALTARVAGRQGYLAAVLGGLCYALWYPAVYAERTTLLEPLGNTGLLVALLLVARPRDEVTRRAEILAGAALGLAVCVKIWMIVPLAVLVVWQLLTARLLGAARVAVGAVLAAVVVVLPFVVGGGPMFRMVVLDQLGRPRMSGLLARLSSIMGLRPFGQLVPDVVEGAVLLLVLAVVAVAVVVAASVPGPPRLYVGLLLANLALLIGGPSYFEHYGTLASVPWALVLATAAARASARFPGAARGWSPVGVAVTLALLAHHATTLRTEVGEPFPASVLAPAVAGRRCVTSDDPTALAALDVLSSDLRRGCPLLVDATGETYDRAAMYRPDGAPVPRGQNQLWQRVITAYLLSGSATVLAREAGVELDERSLRRIRSLPLVARAGRYEVRGR